MNALTDNDHHSLHQLWCLANLFTLNECIFTESSQMSYKDRSVYVEGVDDHATRSAPKLSVTTDVQLIELISLDGMENKEWYEDIKGKREPVDSDEDKLNQVMEMLSRLGTDVCQRFIERLSTLKVEQVQTDEVVELKVDLCADEGQRKADSPLTMTP